MVALVTAELLALRRSNLAADYYLKMSGDTVAVPNGAVEQGSVTPEEIAEILHTDELTVRAETSWSVGSTD